MQATRELAADHEMIEQALATLERAVAAAERTKIMPVTFIKHLVTFSRSFVDQCHHGKEERCLFPCLIRRGVSAEGGPIEMMLREHDEGRRLVGLIDRSLARYEEDGATLEEALGFCRDYIDLLRGHIAKETQVLFPIADGVMTEDDDADTRQCFADRQTAPGTRAFDVLIGLDGGS